MLPVPSIDALADFSGRPAISYSSYATQALTQATLMFSVATELEQWPDDPDLNQVALYAVLEMADKLTLEQPYQNVRANPFQSETIGSYSYSRSQSFAAKAGQDVDAGAGLFWWATALDLFRRDDVLLTASGSIAVASDGLVAGPDGGLRVESPIEQAGLDRPPYIRIS